MNEYPRMLYWAPGPEPIHEGFFACRIVGDASECDAAVAEGWALTTPEALAAKEQREAALAAQSSAPVFDRAALVAQAETLGIKVDGRWSDKKLNDLIAAELEQ
jgi:hypothetical protein